PNRRIGHCLIQLHHPVKRIARLLLALKNIDQQRRDRKGGDCRQDNRYDKKAARLFVSAVTVAHGFSLRGPGSCRAAELSECPTERWQRVQWIPSAVPCTLLPSMAWVMAAWQWRHAPSTTSRSNLVIWMVSGYLPVVK